METKTDVYVVVILTFTEDTHEKISLDYIYHVASLLRAGVNATCSQELCGMLMKFTDDTQIRR